MLSYYYLMGLMVVLVGELSGDRGAVIEMAHGAPGAATAAPRGDAQADQEREEGPAGDM